MGRLLWALFTALNFWKCWHVPSKHWKPLTHLPSHATHHIPEDWHCQLHHCENLKTHKVHAYRKATLGHSSWTLKPWRRRCQVPLNVTNQCPSNAASDPTRKESLITPMQNPKNSCSTPLWGGYSRHSSWTSDSWRGRKYVPLTCQEPLKPVTQHHITTDGNPWLHYSENLKTHTHVLFLPISLHCEE
jgi:hypothetical protein